MAKKKNFLEDFEFKKLENLSNGLEIPITNPLKQEKTALGAKEIQQRPIDNREAEKPLKTNLKGHNVELPSFDYKHKEVKPMINVVPTSKAGKREQGKPERQSITNYGFDKEEFGALTTKEDKVIYLAMRGWSLKVEQRRNALFHYATKYINRKKKRIYLGSVLS
jgi:hypothetical protein